MERRQLLSTFTVTNTTDTLAAGSLRWAILQVDADSGGDSIQFDISSSGVQTISLTSPLPVISEPTVIDGTTQPGYESAPLIEINGSGAGAGANGLTISAGSTTVRGLAIVGCAGSGIVLESAPGNILAANYLGVDASSQAADPNQTGISINGSADNTIGGSSLATANVISGNTAAGIAISDAVLPADQNLIVANIIGVAPGGASALANGMSGILITGSNSTQIGGIGAGMGNVISGNLGAGIKLAGGAGDTLIEGNLIGTDESGEIAVPNGGDGILIASGPGTQVGGGGGAGGNEIAANTGDGVDIVGGSGIVVAGNFIGTDPTGALSLGNQKNGVSIGSSGNTIGGSSAIAGNLIENNGAGLSGAGVQLVGLAAENSILSNSIYNNAGLGINLGDGPTPNHQPGTPGPNNYQNYPVLSEAQSDGSATQITGTLSAAPSASFLIQFFSSPMPDSTGFGQGKNYLGSAQVSTNASGIATFSAPCAGATPGTSISATATDSQGDTSEFSQDVTTEGAINLVVTGTVTPATVLAGGDATYTFTVANEGNQAAQDVEFADQFPAALTVLSVKSSVGMVPFGPSGGDVGVGLRTIAAGGSATVTIVVQASGGSTGPVSDTASVNCNEPDPDPANESCTLAIDIQAAADLSVTLASSSPTVLVDGDLTYVMTVQNLGPDQASGITATLPLGANLQFVSATTTAGQTSSTPSSVTATLASLDSGSSMVVTVVVEPLAVGSLTETAAVISNSQDPNAANNSATVTTTVDPSADLAVNIGTSAGKVAPSIAFNYIVTVVNNGPSDAGAVTLTDDLPAGVTYTTATSDQGVTPSEQNGVVTLSLSDLANGSSATLTISVVVDAGAGPTIVDSAQAASSGVGDPNSANNTATLPLPVVGLSDETISAAASASAVDAGQNFTYTITVSNGGPDDEPDASVAAQFASDMQFGSDSLPSGQSSLKAGLYTANLGPLPAGSSTSFTITVADEALNAETLTTTFDLRSQNLNAATTDMATVAVDVAAASVLSITPSNVPPAAYPTISAPYTFTVSNLGPSNATDVDVSSLPPVGGAFMSAASSQGSAVLSPSGEMVALLGSLPQGESASVTVWLEPTASSGSVVLSTGVQADQPDPGSSDQNQVTVPIEPAADLNLTMTASPTVVLSGGVLTLTTTVTNTGPSTATGVAINLPLEQGLQLSAASTSQGSTSLQGETVVASLGNLPEGATATIVVQTIATTPGTVAETASAVATVHLLDQATASATATVSESAGLLEFATSSCAVPENAGVANLVVSRLDGSLGAVTVSYQTVAVNAVPGRDFTPVAGVLSFADGQASATIQVPVLPDPWDNHDEFVNVILNGPTGGANLGPNSSSSLRIIDIDPDVTPPTITQLSWSGTQTAITSVNLAFSAPLDPNFASDPLNFRLIDTGSHNAAMPLLAPQYNPATFTVTLVPTAPLVDDHFYQVEVFGQGPSAVRDLAGNLLAGAGAGAAGTNYVASFAQGKRLQYTDNSGNLVTLNLSGTGYLEDIRDSSGEGTLLTVMDVISGHSTLSGKVKKVKHSSGRTNLGTLQGLGNFGAVKVTLASPPFSARQYAFGKHSKGVL
jgi:uncharacterized repeat protein (TIGR01451 family)